MSYSLVIGELLTPPPPKVSNSPTVIKTPIQTKPPSIPTTRTQDTIIYVTTLPHRGRVGPPPSKEVATTSNTATQQRKRNLPTQTYLHFRTISYLSRGVAVLTKGQPFPYIQKSSPTPIAHFHLHSRTISRCRGFDKGATISISRQVRPLPSPTTLSNPNSIYTIDRGVGSHKGGFIPNPDKFAH